MRFTIQHLTGSRAGTSQVVDASLVRMGRDPSSEVAFDAHVDDAVSANHCQLVASGDGGVQVVDVGSSNGTYLNGQRIPPQTPTLVISGAVLRLGEEGPKVSVVFTPVAPTALPATAAAMPIAKPGGGRLLMCLLAAFLMAMVGLGGALVVFLVLRGEEQAAEGDPADPAASPEDEPGDEPAASPEDEPAPTPSAADSAADLSHVQVGQVYVYRMSGGMLSEWTVDAVAENEVTYTTVNMMDMGQGMQPLGEPTQQTWRYQVPESTGETSDAPQPETRRESAEVSGVEFDCLVVESEAGGVRSSTWATMSPGSEAVSTFPGVVKSLSGGDPVMELIEIRQPE